MSFLLVTFAFVRSPYFSVFHPLTFYCAFHGLLFVFRPIVAQILDFQMIYRAYEFTPSASDKLTVILASNLGFLCFALFCMREGSVAMTFKQDRVTDAERGRLAQLFPWVALICLPIGAWSLANTWNDVSEFAGHADMQFNKGNGVFTSTKSSGYAREAQLMLASLGAIFAWLMRFRLWSLAPLVAFVVFRAGTGGRGPFVTALASVGLLYLFEQRRRLPTMRVAAGMVALVLSFAAVGSDRGGAIRGLLGEQTDVRVGGSDRLRFMEGMDFGNLEYFEYLVYVVPQRSDTYGYFNGVLQLVTEPIPRAWWAGKPVGAPFERISLFDYGFPIGMTRSLPGEGWHSLGWLGVMIWCGLWGWVLGLIYRRFADGSQGTFHTVGYMIFVPILIIAFRDGQIATIFRQGIFFFAPILLWIGFARWLKVPSASMVRARLARQPRLQPDEVPADILAAAAHGLVADGLPPAVRRRRAALGRSTAMSPTTPERT
jgi:hypothetical protein